MNDIADAATTIGSWWSPTTDRGVFIQVGVTLGIGLLLAVAVRRERSLVELVLGVTMVVLGWYGIRALH